MSYSFLLNVLILLDHSMLNNLTIATTVAPLIEAATIGVESNESFGETNDERDTTNKFECKVKSLPNKIIRILNNIPDKMP